LRILVYGGWFGSGNLGDEAILQGVKTIISKRLPDAELVALSTDPEYTQEKTGVQAEKIESPRSLLRHRSRYLELFREADAHLLTGGTPFYDYGHLSRVIHMGLPALSKKQVYCFGVGSKSITTLIGREITRMLLKNAAIISTRDVLSKQILQLLTGLMTKPITVTAHWCSTR
jgi:polysaccharide pyruvyl transferase WcaK-like protein